MAKLGNIERSPAKMLLLFVFCVVGFYCILTSIHGLIYYQPLGQMAEQNKQLTEFTAKPEVPTKKKLTKFWVWEPRRPKARYKIIVWGYFRGGSSFLSQLASAKNNTAYFFEPLWLYEKSNKLKETKGEYLQKLFECDEDLLKRMFKHGAFLFPSKLTSQEQCMESNLMVAKVNRLYGNEDMNWLIDDPQIGVVHAFRDPRAIYASRRFFIDMKEGGEPEKICKKMAEDMKVLETLPEERYFQIRLEDVVQDPLKTTRQLYDFMGEEVDEDVMNFMKTHMSETPKQVKNKALSTYRDPKDLNKKMKNLNPGLLKRVEEACEDVITALGYPLS